MLLSWAQRCGAEVWPLCLAELGSAQLRIFAVRSDTNASLNVNIDYSIFFILSKLSISIPPSMILLMSDLNLLKLKGVLLVSLKMPSTSGWTSASDCKTPSLLPLDCVHSVWLSEVGSMRSSGYPLGQQIL